jgi:hypothetical protein
MVFCIIGLVIFGILGIFSAKYRVYFKESLRCISRQIVLKPCDTDFDNKMKAKITAKIMKISPALSKFVFKRFLVITWIFIVLLFISIGMVVLGVFNWVVYQNCNGPDSSEFCVFNIDSTSASSSVEGCVDPTAIRSLGPAGPGQGHPSIGSDDLNITVTEFGCYTCKYTKKAEPIVKEMLQKYGDKIRFVYRPFPIPSHNNSRSIAEASYCAWEQGSDSFWTYHNALFENQERLADNATLFELADRLLDSEEFKKCFEERRYSNKVTENYNDGINAGIYGTPTLYVNERYVVGPKSLGDIENLIIEEMKG